MSEVVAATCLAIPFFAILARRLASGASFGAAFSFSAIAWCAFALAITETASLFSVVTPRALWSAWLLFDIASICLLAPHARGIASEILDVASKTSLSKLIADWRRRCAHAAPFEKTLVVGAAAIIFILLSATLLTALLAPPNTWDSMTYHLPKVEHWIQNKSLLHYPTNIPRQLFLAPLAEILILQGRILSGGDKLANMVQWAAFAGSLVSLSSIASLLGLSKRGCLLCVLFFATTPMALLQASSTQTDLVESFFAILSLEQLLRFKRRKTAGAAAVFGAALGFAILTKGTAYPILCPFVAWFSFICLNRAEPLRPGAANGHSNGFARGLAFGALAAAICVAINIPHLARNHAWFGAPLPIQSNTTSSFGIKPFVPAFIANVYINAGPPMSAELFDKTYGGLLLWLKLDPQKIFPYRAPVANQLGSFVRFHEDVAPNPFQTVGFLVALLVCLMSKSCRPFRLPAALALASWCVFSLGVPYQPWITRLHLPLFALSAPVFAIAAEAVFERRRGTVYAAAVAAACLVASCFAVAVAFKNETRPLLGKNSLLLISRDQAADNLSRRYPHNKRILLAVDEFLRCGDKTIGLRFGGDTWEYPIWNRLRRAQKHGADMPRIAHIIATDPAEIDPAINSLIVFNAPLDGINELVGDGYEMGQPCFLRRADSASPWKLAMPLPPPQQQ